jgi:hypothetical protein
MAKAVGWVKWREARENESIILQLDSESRFRDAARRKSRRGRIKEEKGWSSSPSASNAKKSFFGNGHCQAPRVPAIFLLLEAQHSSSTLAPCSTHISWCSRARRPSSDDDDAAHIKHAFASSASLTYRAGYIHSGEKILDKNPPRIFCCPSDGHFVK